MKRILTLILTALCLAPVPVAAQAYKSAPVTVSQEVVEKDGKFYLAHTVLDHQTLFSISRTYGVTFQDILDANPGLDLAHGQIQVGQVLLIPAHGEKEQETAAAAQESAAAEQDGFLNYTVKWYEDLDMIAARFNVPKETLMAVNGMKTDQVARRQRLRIPLQPDSIDPETIVPVTPAAGTETADGTSEEQLPDAEELAEADETAEAEAGLGERLGFSLRDLFRKKRPSDRISVGVILPFNAKGQISHSSFDLYSGLLLAVRDLAKTGIQADLSVLDNKNPATAVTEDQLKDFDLVIGPVAPEDLETVLENCPRSTAVVSPLDPKAAALAMTHPNLIQAPSSANAQYRDLIEWVRDDMQPGDRIVLVTEKDAEPSALETRLAESGLNYEKISYGPDVRSIVERIKGHLTSGGITRVILAVEKEVYAYDAVRSLAPLNFSRPRAILYAPSRIRTFDMVEVENLHRANAHLSCSYFIDYDNERIKDFLLSYRALFGGEPTQFAYQGYDMGWFFIRNFATSERERERMTRLEDRYTGLQSDFLITDEDGSGHVNSAVRRVVYQPDYSITLLSQ